MRLAVSVAILMLACFALASAQTTTSSGSVPTVQKASLAAGETTVTGCLQGKTDGYYLTEKDGTMRLLMGPTTS
jgi:hypothetical protein